MNLFITRRVGWGEGMVREFGINMYTLLYLKWITNKDLLYSTGNRPALIHVYVWLSPFAGHLKLSHCQLTISQYKINSF